MDFLISQLCNFTKNWETSHYTAPGITKKNFLLILGFTMRSPDQKNSKNWLKKYIKKPKLQIPSWMTSRLGLRKKLNVLIIFILKTPRITVTKSNESSKGSTKKSSNKCSTMLRFSVTTDIVKPMNCTGGIKFNKIFNFTAEICKKVVCTLKDTNFFIITKEN